jgi:DNA-binding NarL/FixJ family response regulator
MASKSHINETVIANALVAIFERLDALEKATNVLAGQHVAQQPKPPANATPRVEQAVLLQKLEKLTFKRHAVLTATLGGQSYQAIAKAMGCNLTTVKLHLKAALNILGLRDRSTLLAKASTMLDFIHDSDYEARYGIGKRWWLEDNDQLMAVLMAKKPAGNQHTRN